MIIPHWNEKKIEVTGGGGVSVATCLGKHQFSLKKKKDPFLESRKNENLLISSDILQITATRVFIHTEGESESEILMYAYNTRCRRRRRRVCRMQIFVCS